LKNTDRLNEKIPMAGLQISSDSRFEPLACRAVYKFLLKGRAKFRRDTMEKPE
jgi:hypothetical protein